ncbi:MAG: hypothetical protein U1E83_00445 [Methylotetracoccus sp.]
MSDDFKAYRDAALQRIGRNVVNFQKLESLLKQLIPALDLAGTFRHDEFQPVSGSKRLTTSTLGALTTQYVETVFGQDREVLKPTLPGGVSFGYSFRIEADSVDVDAIKAALVGLVQERNRLIHSDLHTIDFGSIDDCTQLSAQLDEQNERIREQFYYLSTLGRALAESLAELKALFESDEIQKRSMQGLDGS